MFVKNKTKKNVLGYVIEAVSQILCFFYMENVRHMYFPIQKHNKTHVF
jgi:hypothetical protein